MIEQIYYSEYEDIPMNIEPKTMEEILALYGEVKDDPIVAMGYIQDAIKRLKHIKGCIYELQDIEKELKDTIAVYMKDHATLISHDGEVLATWKRATSSVRFNEKLFKIEQSELYQKYLEQREGNRSFLVK